MKKKFTTLLLCLLLLLPPTVYAFWGLAETGTTVGGLTPDTFVAGDDGKVLLINWSGASITASTPAGGGDMSAAVWDGDTDGFIDPDAGGTDINTSASTGVPSIAAGTWSVAATLTHELGGLEADVSAYAGLVKINAGSTSAVAVTANGESLITAANYAAMRTLLDLEAGTDFYNIAGADAAFQAIDDTLTSIAALGTAADKIAYTTGIDTWAEGALTAFARSILDDADEATFKATVNLEAGTDVQAQNATLQVIADASDVPGANVDIANTTAEASIASNDLILIYDVTAAANRAMTRGNFVSGIGAGQAIVLDIGDDGGDDSTDLGEIATTGDTNSVITEPAADKMLINFGNNWPTADVAVLANTGDSATAFFSSGTVEEARIHADLMRDSEWTQGTVSAQGKLELATTAEATALVDTARAITAAGLLAALQGGTYDLSGATITFGLVAGDIPDISATYEVQLVDEAGLYGVLSDVTMFLEDLVDDTTPQLGGALDVNSQEIQTSGNMVIQLGSADGSSYLEIQNSSSIAAHRFYDDGTWGPAESGDPYLLFNDDTLTTEFVIYAKDTTTDVLQFGWTTDDSAVLANFTMGAELSVTSGNFNIIGQYQVDGGQIDFADLAGTGNVTLSSGTWDFSSATDVSYKDATVDIADINASGSPGAGNFLRGDGSWATSTATLQNLSDTVDIDYTGGTIIIGDNSDSFDEKVVSGAITLAADGTTTLNSNSTILTSLAIGADPADAEEIRLPVGGAIAWEDAGTEVTLTHIDTEGLRLNVAHQLQFRDAALSISSADDGHLDFVADVSVDFDAPAATFSGSMAAAGAITGLNSQGADITGNTAHDTVELHGVMYKFTAAATVTLDAAADAGYGACASYRIRDAAEAAVIDPQAGEKINLAGVPLAAGVAITATGAGEYLTVCATTDTDGSGTDGYDVYGPTSGWASE